MTSRRLRSANIGLALGHELQRLRADRTQGTIAKLANIARPIYARAERGYHEPTISFLAPLVTAMGGDPAELIGQALARATPPGPIPRGPYICESCPYFPQHLARDEGGPCEHPDTLPVPRVRPALVVIATGDRSPPSECPRRTPRGRAPNPL